MSPGATRGQHGTVCRGVRGGAATATGGARLFATPMSSAHACQEQQGHRRGRSITRALGYALGLVGSIVVTVAVAFGAMAYFVVAWGQRRRRITSGRAARV